jgi:protein polybromo-1
MVFRPSTLEPKRVQSVFKDRIERHKEEIEELEELEKMVEEDLPPNVVWENNEVNAGAGGEASNVYYEQVSFFEEAVLSRVCFWFILS